VRRGLVLGLILLVAGAAWIGLRDWRRGYVSTRGATVTRFTIHSELVQGDLHEILVVPAGGGRGRELLVFLHGRGSPPDSNLRQPLFDALHDLGRRAPAVLLVDGGDHSYWHDRRDGRWGTSVLREAIPAPVARSHADEHRIAIGGISMGGFGALDLASRAPGRFCAVGAHSAALWFRGADTPSGAFDDADDFARHDLLTFARTRALYRVPVWIDVGREDPFPSGRYGACPRAASARNASAPGRPRRRTRRLVGPDGRIPPLLRRGVSLTQFLHVCGDRRATVARGLFAGVL
jgi:pimeloyl-ACP methyl ester carboxylesterase